VILHGRKKKRRRNPVLIFSEKWFYGCTAFCLMEQDLTSEKPSEDYNLDRTF
jgi:hypothetical protein